MARNKQPKTIVEYLLQNPLATMEDLFGPPTAAPAPAPATATSSSGSGLDSPAPDPTPAPTATSAAADPPWYQNPVNLILAGSGALFLLLMFKKKKR